MFPSDDRDRSSEDDSDNALKLVPHKALALRDDANFKGCVQRKGTLYCTSENMVVLSSLPA
jgi:hypothetical protein